MLEYESLFIAFATGSIILLLIGVYGIWFQLKKSKDVAAGQLIAQLSYSFAKNQDIQEIYHKLRQYHSGKQSVFNEQHLPKIDTYLDFFTPLHSMHEQRILSMKTIDKNFLHPFFMVLNHPYAQNYILKHEERYASLLMLYKRWVDYRKKHRKSEPYLDYSMSILLGRKKYS